MAPSEQDGYFSSNRPEGTGKDDIYSFQVLRPQIEIIVMDTTRDEPIEGASISILDRRHNSTDKMTTDIMGRIQFVADFGVDYTANLLTDEYGEYRLDMSTVADTGQQLFFSYKIELGYTPPTYKAVVIDVETKERINNAEVKVINKTKAETFEYASNTKGRIVHPLESYTKYQVTASKDGYEPYETEVSSVKITFTGDTILPIKKIKIPPRIIVLENVKYDFDQWTIRSDAYNELQEVAKLLDENPGIRIELSSHTDTRGNDGYNRRLSKLRANAAKNFLVLQCGVDHKRISAVGFGEDKPINECSNGTACTEEDHQVNRRTEIKVDGDIQGIDMENSILNTEATREDAPSQPMGPDNY